MANPSFRALLAKSGASAADTTRAIQKLIGDYEVLETALPELKLQLKKKDLSEAERKEATEELASVEEQIPLLDTKITNAVKDWLPKRQQIKERTERMLAGKNKKAQGGAVTPPAAAKPAPPAEPAKPAAPAEPAKPAPAEPAKPAAQNNPPAPSSSTDGKQKSKSPLLGIILAIAGGGLAGFGISFLFKGRD